MNGTKLVGSSVTGVSLVFLFFLFALVFNNYAGSDEYSVEKNIIATHKNIVNVEKKNCSYCHADIHTRTTLNSVIPDAHVAMLPFAPGGSEDEDKRDQRCAWCHRSVDLINAAGSPADSKTNLKKSVDVRLCMLCHGPDRPRGIPADKEPRQFYQVSLAQLQPTGIELYDLACAGCHRDLVDSQVKGKKAREIENAINEDKGGMGPLGILSTDQIQTISSALAE